MSDLEAYDPCTLASGTGRPRTNTIGRCRDHYEDNADSYTPSKLPKRGTTKNTGSCSSATPNLTYALNSDTYSLPPMTDATKGLLEDDEKHHRGMVPFRRTSPPILSTGQPSLRATPSASWWSHTFEPPDWKLLVLHTMLCMIAFLVILLVLPLAQGTIFWVRVYVSLGCSLAGLSIGYSLLQLVRKWIEAAAWATVIHQSMADGEEGIRIRDIATHTSDSASAWVAFKLLWDRHVYVGTRRQRRKSYDKRPWSIFIYFFLLCLLVGASMTFVLGRIVAIDTNVVRQRQNYREIAIAGDLSISDIAAADSQQNGFSDYVIVEWMSTLYGSMNKQVRAVYLDYQGAPVYFAEPMISQLLPEGKGMGTFDYDGTSTTSKTKRDFLDSLQRGNAQEDNIGRILRYPRWGIRIHCEKIPNPSVNILQHSNKNNTYVYIPRDFLSGLFSYFQIELPERFLAFNATNKILDTGDNFPEGADPSSWAAGVLLRDTGLAHSFWSIPVEKELDGGGWASVETIIVRLNTTYAPHGSFSLYNKESIPDRNGQPSRIGYDAAVCVELFEPWVVETYNATTGLPSSLGIVEKWNVARDNYDSEEREGSALHGVQRELNSTGKSSAFVVAHTNSINQMVKEIGRNFYYIPSPTTVSFTDGSGPTGYTSLSGEHLGHARALADATNILPFLAGSGSLVARVYDDEMQASVHVSAGPLIVVLGFALVLGIIAGMLTPRLPLSVPRREFGMYSWLAVLQGDALLGEAMQASAELERRMDVRDVERRIGNVKVRYVV